jgi:glycosyltransferase involved in cell wall biosynthesis
MIVEKKLTFGVILPHTKIFGGVKRFFEIGNILIERGHKFSVFTPDGERPFWFDFKGDVQVLESISQFSFDALFTTEPAFLDDLLKADAKVRVFYAVLQRRYLRKVVGRKNLIIFANSGRLYDYLGGEKRKNLVKCIGGIDANKFHFQPRESKKPSEPFTVLAYGRFYRKKKGTSLVVKACENLYRKGYDVKLLLFDAPVDEQARKMVSAFTCKVPFEFFVDYPVERLADLYYKADVFVSAERNAGWSNTTAEAMACGVPVVATNSGTEDFLFHNETGLRVWRHPYFIRKALERLIHDPALARRLAANGRKKITEFSWTRLADFFEDYISA